MNDNYSHNDINIIYITESIPGPKESSTDYDNLLESYNSQYDGCVCKRNCNVSVCDCLRKSHGINYEQYNTGEKEIFILSMKPDAYPIYECTSECLCNSLCGNRVVQRGPIEGLTVKSCENIQKGKGLYTLHSILKGSFVCEYAGEVLTKAQALTRTKENESKKHDNYIFCLNEHSTTETIQTFVDPSQFGNIGRYINHSCDPNCCVVPVRFDNLIPKLAIFACKNIQSNEEITFRYGADSDCLSESVQTKISAINCHCNADKCQGFLPYNDF